jgi:hypothetical protein
MGSSILAADGQGSRLSSVRSTVDYGYITVRGVGIYGFTLNSIDGNSARGQQLWRPGTRYERRDQNFLYPQVQRDLPDEREDFRERTRLGSPVLLPH